MYQYAHPWVSRSLKWAHLQAAESDYAIDGQQSGLKSKAQYFFYYLRSFTTLYWIGLNWHIKSTLTRLWNVINITGEKCSFSCEGERVWPVKSRQNGILLPFMAAVRTVCCWLLWLTACWIASDFPWGCPHQLILHLFRRVVLRYVYHWLYA